MSSPLNLYGLTGVYADAYAAIVRPEKVFRVTRYFLREWAPLLGPSGFWFVTALRQRCFWNEKQNWCIVDEKTLALESATSESTVRRIKNGVEKRPEDTLLSWFFRPVHRRRWSDRARHSVQAPDRYHVLIDDPLTPNHQAGLAQLLRKAMLDGDPLESVMRELRRLRDITDGTLPDILAEAAADAEKLPQPAFTALDVVKGLGVWPDDPDRQVELAQLCSEVQSAIVQPGNVLIYPQYFRLNWLPILEPTLGLLILTLRSRCYYNPESGELRDECEAHWSELAREIGRTCRTIRTLRKDKPELFGAFVIVLEEAVGRAPARFRVQMLDPLLPVDAPRFAALVRGETVAVDPETGQIAMRLLATGQHEAPSEQGKGSAILTLSETLKAEVLTVSESRKAEVLAASGPRKAEVLTVSEPRNAEVLTANAEVLTFSIKSTISTVTPKALLKKKNVTITVEGAPAEESALQAFSSSFVPVLLDDFGITGTPRREILAKGPGFQDVAGWMLYAIAQRGLDEDRLEGYVVKRLWKEPEPAPEDFRMLADLLPAGWTLFWRADRYGGPYLDAVPEIYQELFQIWQRHFGGLFPEGPFGDDTVRARKAWEQALAALGDQVPDGVRSCEVFATDRPPCLLEVEAADADTATWLEANSEKVEQALAEQGVYHWIEVVWPQEEEAGAGDGDAVPPMGGPTEANRIWQAALGELQLQMTKATFDTWVRDTRLVSCQDGVFVIGAQDEFARDWLENRLRTTAERTLVGIVGEPVQVRFVIQDEGDA